MHHHVPEIEQEPAFARLSFYTALFLEIAFGCLQHALGQCVEHAVTGAVADDEIIGKRCDVFDVEEQDVFALFVLQGFDDFMG